MKKLLILGFLLLMQLEFAIAQGLTASSDLLVTADVAKHVYILSAPDLDLGDVNNASGDTGSAIIKIRSNHSSWTFSVYALKGVLTQYTGTTSSPVFLTGPTVTTIPYTFTFNGVGTLTSTAKIVDQILPTGTATANTTATFTAKTSGGSLGQDFNWGVTISPVPGGAAWDAANYMDILYFTVTAL